MLAFFPNLIHVFEVETFKQIKDELVKFSYIERKRNPLGKDSVVSSVGGWHSDDFKSTDDNIIVSTVKNEVFKYFLNNKIFKDGAGLDIKGIWININKKGDYNLKHFHPTHDLSGVFWIKTPEKCGNLEFESPNELTQYKHMDCYSDEIKKHYNIFHSYWFSPVEGRMIIFPSSLSHSVDPNQSREDRISISFNADLVR